MLNRLRSSVYTRTATHFTLSIRQFIMYSCKEPNTLACRFQLKPVDFKTAQACQLSDVSHAFISTADTTMSSLYSGVQYGEIIGITVENKHINGLEINLECVIITFNHGFWC